MQCTHCNSENTQRLSVIYQSGTQHISTTSTIYGVGGGSGFGLGTATASTSGTAQSYLATKASPPPKKSYKMLLLIVPGIAIGGFAGNILLFAVIAGIGIFLGYKSYRYNKDAYPGLRQTWLRSWHCNKCGSIYTDEIPFYSSTKQS